MTAVIRDNGIDMICDWTGEGPSAEVKPEEYKLWRS